MNKRLKSVLSYCYHCIHPGREERSREEERRKEERGGIPLIGGNNSGQDVQVCRCAETAGRCRGNRMTVWLILLMTD